MFFFEKVSSLFFLSIRSYDWILDCCEALKRYIKEKKQRMWEAKDIFFFTILIFHRLIYNIHTLCPLYYIIGLIHKHKHQRLESISSWRLEIFLLELKEIRGRVCWLLIKIGLRSASFSDKYLTKVDENLKLHIWNFFVR